MEGAYCRGVSVKPLRKEQNVGWIFIDTLESKPEKILTAGTLRVRAENAEEYGNNEKNKALEYSKKTETSCAKMGINFARGVKCIGMRTQSKSKIQNRFTTEITEEDLRKAYEETQEHEKNVNPIFHAT